MLLRALASLVVLSSLGCNKTAVTGGGGGSDGGAAPSSTGGSGPAAALLPVGMEDPFARLPKDAAKSLSDGNKALRAKEYDAARAAFRKVVVAAPDHTTARFQEIRAIALAGAYADLPPLWGELLARDHAAYAGRLDKPKDLTALRASAVWPRLRELEKSYQAPYARDLDKGLFFVARHRDVQPLKLDAGPAKLDLAQEVYHHDVAHKRYRRLTATDGQVYAINVSPDRKQLSYVTVSKVTPYESNQHGEAAEKQKVDLVEVRGAVVDLATLTTIGPLPVGEKSGKHAGLWLTWTAKNEPVFGTQDHKSNDTYYTFDSAHTGLVEIAKDQLVNKGEDHWTFAFGEGVSHRGGKPAGVKVDGKTLVLEGQQPLRATRDIDSSSVEWSPDKKHLSYSSNVDSCTMLAQLNGPKGTKVDKNEIYLWDATSKSVHRLAAAISQFENLWLDDDHLVYEGGVGKEGKIHIYEVSTKADSVLKTRSGAGIYGFPQLSCDRTPPEDDASDDKDDTGGDPQ